jgi:hypothetical protein
VRKNSKLKDYCSELQGEIENIWGQANQRISALTAKMRGLPRPLYGPLVDTANGAFRYGTRGARSQAEVRRSSPCLGESDQGALAITRALQQAEAEGSDEPNSGASSNCSEVPHLYPGTRRWRSRSRACPVTVAPSCHARWCSNWSAQLLSSQCSVHKDPARLGRNGGME